MNTLAVIEAGEPVRGRDLPTAMTSIALAYTLGSIAGTLATGLVESQAPGRGLTLVAGTAAAIFLGVRAWPRPRALPLKAP